MEIMAKPTGAVDASDFGYDITSAGDTRDDITFYSYIYVVAKVDLQPGKWATTNREDLYHKHSVSMYVDVASGGELRAAIRIGKQTPDANAVFTEPGVSSDWITTSTESLSGGRTNTLPNYNESKIQPQYIIIEARISRNSTATLSENVEVYALFVESENDSSYAGNDAVSFNSDTVTKRMNNPFDSLNASMFKDAIGENLNKIMYESKNAFTVPLFGAY
jgi:hypothetical protein